MPSCPIILKVSKSFQLRKNVIVVEPRPGPLPGPFQWLQIQIQTRKIRLLLELMFGFSSFASIQWESSSTYLRILSNCSHMLLSHNHLTQIYLFSRLRSSSCSAASWSLTCCCLATWPSGSRGLMRQGWHLRSPASTTRPLLTRCRWRSKKSQLTLTKKSSGSVVWSGPGRCLALKWDAASLQKLLL